MCIRDRDSTLPTFTTPSDITIDCAADETNLTLTGDVLDEADNCDTSIGEARFTDSESTDDPCTGSSVISRTWTLTDACGNSAVATQTITKEDSTLPTFTTPSDITIDCAADETNLTLTGDVLDEADNCDTSIGEASFTDSESTDDPCMGSSEITRTWTLTDACGNSAVGTPVSYTHLTLPTIYSV